MTRDEEWDRLSTLFDEVSSLDVDEQQRYLATLDAEDASLADALRRMLRHGREGSPLLDDPARSIAGMLTGLQPEPIPERVAGYRILRQIGEGGMGRVFLAEREAVGGLAALKVLRDAWASPERRHRFLREQETLARLHHPDIAQLYEVGVLRDGTPWFAMEYVEGVSLTERVTTTHASVRERLLLVRAVCRAVQHAHAHAIIHRDIKPSNVMVTPSGAVKLLDFGIAKQLDSEDPDAERTRTGYRMLTPDYAAPEQFTGGAVGVQTDVHAIGVLLYELLALRLPWAATPGGSDPAMALQRREAADLSELARRGPMAPGRAQWRELDVLVRTALHQDPARRYPSVEALGRDIDHYLAQEPLEARPDTLRYRAGRLVRRRWRELGAVTAVLGSVAVLTVLYASGLARARDEARGEAARSARVQAFLVRLFQGDDEATGPSDTLRVTTLIDRGEREAAGLEADPALRADIRETLGELRRQLGEYPASNALLEASLAERLRLGGPGSIDVARSLIALGRLRLDEARYTEADSLLTTALGRLQPLLPADHPLVLEGRSARARGHQEQGEYAKAVSEEKSIVALLAAHDSASIEYARALVELANSQFYLGELDTADALNRRALSIFRARRGDRHPDVADVLINLGASQFERGDYAAAESLDVAALDRITGWYGDDHPERASALTILGRAVVAQNRPQEADTLLRNAMTILQRHYGPNHPRVASALNELGNLALQQKRYADAERYFQRNLEIYQHLYTDPHWLTGVAAGNIGSVSLARGENAAAERWFRKALAQFTQSQGPRHLNTAIMQVKLGRSLLRQRRYREAVEATGTGYTLLTERTDAPEGFIKAARADLAAAYEQLGDHAQAERFATPPE